MTEASVAALADLVGGRVQGDGGRLVRGLCDLRAGAPDRLGFVRHAKYLPLAKTTAAGAVLAAEPVDTPATLVLVDDVHAAYAKIASFFHPPPRASSHEIHPSAVVDPRAELTAPVRIGPNAVVGNCRIGRGTVVFPNVTIGDGCVLGEDCTIYANVSIYGGVRLGNRVIVHSGSVLGSDGFGFAQSADGWLKVPQLGGLVLEDDVELQAGVMVDRGALGDTRIGRGTKLDNGCHVAHNVQIGSHVVMAGGCFIAGSAKIGDRCVLGGDVGVVGHIEVGADVRIGGGSMVLKNLLEPGEYMGDPLLPMRQYARLAKTLRQFGQGQGGSS